MRGFCFAFDHHVILIKQEVRQVMIGIAFEVVFVGLAIFNVNFLPLQYRKRLSQSAWDLFGGIVENRLVLEMFQLFRYEVLADLKKFHPSRSIN